MPWAWGKKKKEKKRKEGRKCIWQELMPLSGRDLKSKAYFLLGCTARTGVHFTVNVIISVREARFK